MTFMPTGFAVRLRMSRRPGAEFMAVDVDQGERLDDADAAGLGGGGHQLRVAARVHGAAEERHLDPELLGERGLQQRHGMAAHANAAGPGSAILIPTNSANPLGGVVMRAGSGLSADGLVVALPASLSSTRCAGRGSVDSGAPGARR